MSKIIQYLDSQSDIQLVAETNISKTEIRTTDLLFLLKGSAEIEIDGKQTTMNADDVVIINKYENYKVVSDKTNLLFYFSISDFLLSQALEIEQATFNCNSIENPNRSYETVRSIIIPIIDLLLFENERTNFLQLSKVYKLLNEVSSLFLEQSNSLSDRDERIQQITRTIRERYYENITLTEMANLIHMDVAYFSKYFKKIMGVNFKDYLSDIRMEYALRDLLESDKLITRIAIDNGFFSVNGFNKKFKELYQQTPSEYRQQHITNQKQDNIIYSDEIKESFNKYKEKQNTTNILQKKKLELTLEKNDYKPMKETWSEILNIGEAKIVLNSNLRKQVLTLQQNLNFKYGRIWSLFNSKVLGEGLNEYDMLDEVIDYLLNLDLIPWISINKITDSFKESEYPIEVWSDVIRDFCVHLLNRYGKQQVANWKIEIIASAPEDSDSISRYKVFYQTTRDICKGLIPDISIGGGTFVFTTNLELEEFFYHKISDCNFDFYSFALFPYSNRLVREKRNFQRITDPDYLKVQIQMIKNLNLNKPIYISEWSNTVSRSNLMNDTLYKGTFIIKSLIDIFDQVDGVGYWLATDLAQKNPHYSALLTGGNGLLNKNGLFKPAMNAMKFFDQLRNMSFVYKDDRHLICKSYNEDEFFILGHNYTHPNSLYYLKDEAHLKYNEINQFFEKNEFEEELILFNIPNGTYELRVFSCLKGHGDLFDMWTNFNFNKNLRTHDLKYLEAKNAHLQTLEEIVVSNKRLIINKNLTTNEFYEINIKKRQ